MLLIEEFGSIGQMLIFFNSFIYRIVNGIMVLLFHNKMKNIKLSKSLKEYIRIDMMTER